MNLFKLSHDIHSLHITNWVICLLFIHLFIYCHSSHAENENSSSRSHWITPAIARVSTRAERLKLTLISNHEYIIYRNDGKYVFDWIILKSAINYELETLIAFNSDLHISVVFCLAFATKRFADFAMNWTCTKPLKSRKLIAAIYWKLAQILKQPGWK